MNVYNIEFKTRSCNGTMNVAAFFKSDAARIAYRRLEDDGATDIRFVKIVLIERNTDWIPGTTLIL